MARVHEDISYSASPGSSTSSGGTLSYAKASDPSHGSVLAFLITGSGTSIGAIAGALTIARWRVIGLVLATLLVGAVTFGYLYDLLSVLGIL